MSEAEPVEIDVALDDLFADPSLCASAARSYDLLERRVQPNLERSLFSECVSDRAEYEMRQGE